MCRQPWVLVAVLCLLTIPVAPIARADGIAADLDVLRNARIDTDAAGLVAFFKKRTLSEATEKKIADLIRLLGDETFTIREKATNDLIDIGAVTRPMLTRAQSHRDLEVSRRARRRWRRLGRPRQRRISCWRRLACWPTASRPGRSRCFSASCPISRTSKRRNRWPESPDWWRWARTASPRPPCCCASDKQWIKRYAAAEALSRIAAHRAAVHKLLKDDDIGLRRRWR